MALMATNGCLRIKMAGVHTSNTHTHTSRHKTSSHTFHKNTYTVQTQEWQPSFCLTPTVATVPHLICNSKFQKEHLLKKIEKIYHKNAEIWLYN